MENNNEPQIEITTEEVVVEKKPTLNIASAIVIAGLIIAGAILFNRDSASGKGSTTEDKLDLVSSVSDNDLIRGNKNAPITIIEYADFSCHYCAQYHDTLKKLITDEEKKVRWVYRNLPIFNPEAAIAGECVGKLAGDDAFWDFSDKLYANQDKFNTDYYLATAQLEGVSATAFNACVADPLLKNKLQQDFTQARVLLGFNATPHTIIIDKKGRKFSFAGALSYDELKATVDGLEE
jgi:protein-disulfide isomerase